MINTMEMEFIAWVRDHCHDGDSLVCRVIQNDYFFLQNKRTNHAYCFIGFDGPRGGTVNAADSKSVGETLVGSNPTVGTKPMKRYESPNDYGSMALHDRMIIEEGIFETVVIRVNGGFIYRTTTNDECGIPQHVSSVFYRLERS